MILPSMTKNGAILTAFALATTGAVAVVYNLTADNIALQERNQLSTQLQEVLKPQFYDNSLYQDCVLIDDPQLGKSPQIIYRARMKGKPVALIIRHVTPRGYSGDIDLITSIFADGTIGGVRVTKHEETPGLGDKIELKKSPWITLFEGKTVLGENDDRWAVKKDGGNFDQFTGATITPRAVVGSVKDAVLFSQSQFNMIFDALNACNTGDA